MRTWKAPNVKDKTFRANFDIYQMSPQFMIYKVKICSSYHPLFQPKTTNFDFSAAYLSPKKLS